MDDYTKILEQILDEIESNISKKISKTLFKLFTDLCLAGFEREQAIQIICNMKIK